MFPTKSHYEKHFSNVSQVSQALTGVKILYRFYMKFLIPIPDRGSNTRFMLHKSHLILTKVIAFIERDHDAGG